MGENLENLLTINELGALRYIAGQKCNTDQGIRTQLNQLESGVKTSEDVGFEAVRVGPSVFIRITDPALEAFRVKLMAWVKKNPVG